MIGKPYSASILFFVCLFVHFLHNFHLFLYVCASPVIFLLLMLLLDWQAVKSTYSQFLIFLCINHLTMVTVGRGTYDLPVDHSEQVPDSMSTYSEKLRLFYALVVFFCSVIIYSSNAKFPFFVSLLFSFLFFVLFVFFEEIATLFKYSRV